MKKNTFIALLIITSFARSPYAQNICYSPKVDTLYKLISQVCTMDSIFSADTLFQCTDLIKGDTVPIIISKDENGVIDHIGYFLLSDSIHAMNQSVIQYIERELLTILSAKSTLIALRTDYEDGLRIRLDGITQTTDSFQDKKKFLSLIKRCKGFIINRMGKEYNVTMICSGDHELTFSFPANCKLISGMDKREQEIKLAFQLKNHVAKTVDGLIPSPNFDYLQLLQDSIHEECIYVEKGSDYNIPQINNDLFYIENDSIYLLVSDTSFVAMSFSNAMLAPSEKNYTFNVKHRMYGYIVQEYNIDSHNFNDYFSQGYERYFGIETLNPDNFSGTMILYNHDEEYIHLVYVTTTLDDLMNGGDVNMELYSNIPQHNIKTLFGEKKKNENE